MRRRPACDPDPDPLAVWTIVVDGEEIAYGDPAVTNAERAAAGRSSCPLPWSGSLVDEKLVQSKGQLAQLRCPVQPASGGRRRAW